MLPTIADIKGNLRLETTEDDNFISLRIPAAFEMLQKDCNRIIYATQAEYDAVDPLVIDESAMVLNQSLKIALIMLVSHWYENPLPVADAKLVDVPLAYNHIISSYRMPPC